MAKFRALTDLELLAVVHVCSFQCMVHVPKAIYIQHLIEVL